MDKYRKQVKNLRDQLEKKIKEDTRTGIKVTRRLIAGSWKKGTILKPTGDYPIDIDLVFFLDVPEEDRRDVKKIHDFIVKYLEEIYPTKTRQDFDAEGKTKSIKITFSGTGLEVDVVPVIPIDSPENYVWQPQRGGGGDYITSIDGQLDFSQDIKIKNSSYTSIVRAIKWWRNYKELDDFLSSFNIELIVSYLELKKGIEGNIQEGIIRFFEFVSSGDLKEINFDKAINKIPDYKTPVFVGDPTNNENNTTKKMTHKGWDDITSEASAAFDALNRAISAKTKGRTETEWKEIFGPTFNIEDIK